MTRIALSVGSLVRHEWLNLTVACRALHTPGESTLFPPHDNPSPVLFESLDTSIQVGQSTLFLLLASFCLLMGFFLFVPLFYCVRLPGRRGELPSQKSFVIRANKDCFHARVTFAAQLL